MDTSQILSTMPLFSLLDADERGAVAAVLESRTVSEGTVLFEEGAPGDEAFIVRSGAVEVFTITDTGERVVLGRNDDGDVFGEMSLFDGGARSATAVATEATELLVLDRDALLKVLQRYPHVALDILAVMGKRLRATDVMVRTATSKNVNTEEADHLTFGQRIADRVAAFGGSWTFILMFGAILVFWATLNSVILRGDAFDPYPFILLNLFLSMLAALQAPVIMMSQNRQSSKDRLKADLDYDVNLKAELEIAQLHRKMDALLERLAAQNGGRATSGPAAS